MTTVNREVIVFNLGRHYRLVCVDKGAQITPYKVMSHETYNKQFSTFSSL
ncbi:MAG: hypothetical protein MAG453_02136 [Calditrichaeota bacterium]|nr:hypothetical protein [Calditrichota bacterium]